MKTKLVIGVAAGLAAAAMVAAAAKGRCRPGPTMWDKMRERMEEMPEDFPPRIMFDNVQAIRANTDQIIAMLEAQRLHRDTADLATTT